MFPKPLLPVWFFPMCHFRVSSNEFAGLLQTDCLPPPSKCRFNSCSPLPNTLLTHSPTLSSLCARLTWLAMQLQPCCLWTTPHTPLFSLWVCWASEPPSQPHPCPRIIALSLRPHQISQTNPVLKQLPLHLQGPCSGPPCVLSVFLEAPKLPSLHT